MQFVRDVSLVKVPDPLDDQTIVVKFGAKAPAVILIAPELEQVEIFVPAEAVSDDRIVNIFVSFIAAQPSIVAVRVKLTLPAALSATLGE